MSNEKEKKQAPKVDGKNLTLETLRKDENEGLKMGTDFLKSVTGKLKWIARCVISLRLAHSIGSANGYEGTGFHLTATEDGQENFVVNKSGKLEKVKAKEGDLLYDKEGKPVLSVKFPNGYMNSQTKPSGGIWELEENGELLQGIIEACKEANADIVAGKYTEKVKDLLELQLSDREPGTRKRDYSTAIDLWEK